MRVPLTILFILNALIGSAQDNVAQDLLYFNPNTGMYEASQVLSVDSVKGDILYSRAMQWVALNYKSAKDVIQYSSPIDRKVIVKGAFPVFIFMKEGWIDHTLTIEFKDGRYRYQFTNLSYYSTGSGQMPLEGKMIAKKKVLSLTNDRIIEAVEGLHAYIRSSAQQDNW